MIRLIVVVVSAFLSLSSFHSAGAQSPPLKTENVLLVTFDGLRWQELFTGAELLLIDKDIGKVKDVRGCRESYWRDDAVARRTALLPFLWNTVAKQGQIFGDPQRNSHVKVTNGLHFSYPGYNELLSGAADPRIDSNDKRPNPNVTVLERLNRDPEFAGKVAAFTSWDVFPFIINQERSGVPVNSGWQALSTSTDQATLAVYNRIAAELPKHAPTERYDVFTFHGAAEYLKAKQPRVMYVSFDETDTWCHAGRYDLYLDAAQRIDGYLERFWKTLQSLPQYAGKTTMIVTTDHGRGDGRVDWQSHSNKIPGCERIWLAAIGPDVPPLGVRENVDLTQSQVAATVAELLGRDVRTANPGMAPSILSSLKK